MACVGPQSEREDKVSLELTEEILQSMEIGMVFKDYVNFHLLFFFFGFQLRPKLQLVANLYFILLSSER